MEGYCLSYPMLLMYIKALLGCDVCVIVDCKNNIEYVCDVSINEELMQRNLGVNDLDKKSNKVFCVLTKKLLHYSTQGVAYVSSKSILNSELKVCGRPVSLDDVFPWMIGCNSIL